MRHLRLIAAYTGTPWAMEQGTLEALASLILEDRPIGDPSARESHPGRAGAGDAAAAAKENVAVIPIYGVITQRAALVSDICPGTGTSTQAIERALRSAAADSSVRSIVLDVDSPGGSVFGVQELASTIMELRAIKPIAAIANAQASSAAYWIASAAHEVFITPSGVAGSIGVFMAHVDTTKADEAAGKVKTIIKAGKYKAEGEGPLTDEAIAHLQTVVDGYYTGFVKGVAKARNATVETVRNGYGQGRSLPAQAALDAGMVDGIATLQEVIRKYGRRTTETANRRAVAAFPVHIAATASGSAALAAARIRIAEAAGPPALLANPAPATSLEDYRSRITRAADGAPRKR
jgi:signal peptide peptidase SppA